MQPSLSPSGGKHYRHYSQLFRVHNALGEYFNHEGICHYNKNKSQNLERGLEGEQEIKGMCFRCHWASATSIPPKHFLHLASLHHLRQTIIFIRKKNFCNSIRKFTWRVCPCVILWVLLKCYKSLISSLPYRLIFSQDFWNILQMILRTCFHRGDSFIKKKKKQLEIHW